MDMIIKVEEKFTKYETARILGARALQVSMDAPLLLKIEKEELEKINYDPLKIAEIEFSANVLPITVKRPLPRKLETKLKREAEIKKVEEKKLEKKEETTIKAEGEIMELVKPEDEVEEEEAEEEAVEAA